MRILFVNPGGRAQGGAERSLAELIGGLVDEGHECLVFLMAPGDAEHAFARAGARVVDVVERDLAVANRHRGLLAFVGGVARGLPAIIGTARRIRRAAALHDVDVVHSNGFRSHVLTPLYRLPGRPVVWSLRDRAPQAMQRRLLRLSSRWATSVMANSAFTAEQLAGSKVTVVPNPVRPPTPVDRGAARSRLALPPDVTVVAVLAHLHHSKGHDVALDALAHLPAEVHLAIAGGRLYSTSEAFESHLRRSATQPALAGRVHFLGNVEQVADVYAAADAVVHPCRHPEGFGRVIVEAQLTGTPVVATAMGGVLDLIEDGRTGRLVEPDDPRALAAAIEEVLDPAVASRLAAAAHSSAAAYAPQHHLRRAIAVYRGIRHMPTRVTTRAGSTDPVGATDGTAQLNREVAPPRRPTA